MGEALITRRGKTFDISAFKITLMGSKSTEGLLSLTIGNSSGIDKSDIKGYFVWCDTFEVAVYSPTGEGIYIYRGFAENADINPSTGAITLNYDLVHNISNIIYCAILH